MNYKTLPAQGPVDVNVRGWTATTDHLPEDETPVLIVLRGRVRIGELRWEKPTWEETFRAFRYWDDPEDDGQGWEWQDVTHWMPLPEAPNAEVTGVPGFSGTSG